MKAVIFIKGCDDTTAFEMSISSAEMKFLKTIETLSNKASTYNCMPRFTVQPLAQAVKAGNFCPKCKKRSCECLFVEA